MNLRAKALALCILATVLASPSAWAADKTGKKELPGHTVEIKVEPQAWQVRRNETAQTLNAFYASGGKDKAAEAKLDAILTGLEKDPMSITPMEAMDLYGAFYVPNEGATQIASLLKMVAVFAMIGLYDTYRFADASGRAEILNNEGFLKRAFTLGGDAGTKQLVDFLTKHPKEAEAAVSGAANIASTLIEKAHYDVHWPTAYGLARMSCSLEGKKNCPPPEAMPKDKWSEAFVSAVLYVKHYYRDNSKK